MSNDDTDELKAKVIRDWRQSGFTLNDAKAMTAVSVCRQSTLPFTELSAILSEANDFIDKVYAEEAATD